MDANREQPEPAEIDPRTRLRIVSVELNEATAALYKARHDVLYRRLRAVPPLLEIPAWATAMIVGSVGAVLGAIPALLIRGDNLLFVFVAVCAAYTILSPITTLLLADQEGENDSNRLEKREAALHEAVTHQARLQERVAALDSKQREARQALRKANDATAESDQAPDGPGGGLMD
jgi:hypothetical protein